jgi:hypothetical protein
MGGGIILGRDAILKADDLPVEEVKGPEWGGAVLVRGLSGKDRDEFQASTMVIRDGKAYPDAANVTAKLVARCIVGEDGLPLFSQRDVHALGEKSAAALERVGEVASRLSGMTEDAVAEMLGNSAAAPGGDSASTSPPGSDAPLKNFSPGSPPTS